ncbi:MAG: ribosome-recycling factor, partial [Deltaproteobacteria bacterium]|nr:ribosome-recycling factor [Deltaproteobacteria bacterium]
MINDVVGDTKSKMSRAIDVLKAEFLKLRTGRASPSILDDI